MFLIYTKYIILHHMRDIICSKFVFEFNVLIFSCHFNILRLNNDPRREAICRNIKICYHIFIFDRRDKKKKKTCFFFYNFVSLVDFREIRFPFALYITWSGRWTVEILLSIPKPFTLQPKKNIFYL